MSHQTVASIKASDGPGNYCLNVFSSLSLSEQDKLSFVIGNCLITFNKHVLCFLSPWIFDIIKDECCCLKGHVFITLPEETSVRGFLSLKAVIESGVTHEVSNLDKDELYVALKLLGMDIQLREIVTVNECTSEEVDCDDAQEHESIISTEDMFTRGAEVDSADDTNNNKTLEPMEENMDLNEDSEVLKEFNLVNSMENAQRNKPVLKKCEVRINRISKRSFGIMRNCCVKIKRLDRKSLKCNLKGPLPNSLAMPGDVDTCFPQSSPSATPAQPDKEKSRKINFSKESDKSDSLKTSRAIEKDTADIVVPAHVEGNDTSMVPTSIDSNNVQESKHSTVILYSANCDEFFSSFGLAHSTSDAGDGKDTPSHTRSNHLTQIKVPKRSNSAQEYDVEFSNDEEDVEKQIELVPKIKIKRNLFQWVIEKH